MNKQTFIRVKGIRRIADKFVSADTTLNLASLHSVQIVEDDIFIACGNATFWVTKTDNPYLVGYLENWINHGEISVTQMFDNSRTGSTFTTNFVDEGFSTGAPYSTKEKRIKHDLSNVFISVKCPYCDFEQGEHLDIGVQQIINCKATPFQCGQPFAIHINQDKTANTSSLTAVTRKLEGIKGAQLKTEIRDGKLYAVNQDGHIVAGEKFAI